jgi:hypothetical protein
MQYLAWAISCVGIVAIELQIRKRWQGWALSLCSQVLWLIYILGTQAWGLLPMWGMMVLQGVRGVHRWRKEELRGHQVGHVG